MPPVAPTIATLLLLAGGSGSAESTSGQAAADEPTPASVAVELAHAEKVESTAAEPEPETVEKSATASELSPAPQKARKAKPRRYLVADVTDGDTLGLADGQTVRIVGIDTPERGICGYDKASNSMVRMVLGERVRLIKPGASTDNQDRYGRLLRYVMVGNMDTGVQQIRRDLATARYDSRDGYGFHPREDRYHRIDERTANVSCPKSAPPPPAAEPAGNCEAATSPASRRTHRIWIAPT